MKDSDLVFFTNITIKRKETFKWCLIRAGIHGTIKNEAYDRSGNMINDCCSFWYDENTPDDKWKKFDKIREIVSLSIKQSLKKQGIENTYLYEPYFSCEKEYIGPDAECITVDDIEKILQEKEL